MIRRLRLELKNLHFSFWLPILILYVLVPLLNVGDVISSGMDLDSCSFSVRKIAQQFIPLFACWWPVLVYREYLDVPGNELLHVSLHGMDNLLVRALVLGLGYGVLSLPLFIVYGFLWPGMGYLYLAICVQGVWFASFSYCVAVCGKNTFLPLILCVLVAVYAFIFPRMPISPFDYDRMMVPIASSHIKLGVLLGLSVLFLGIGRWREKRVYG